VAFEDLRAFLRELAVAGELVEAPTPLESVRGGESGDSAGRGSHQPASLAAPPAGGLGRRAVGVHGSPRRVALALGLPPHLALGELAALARRRLGTPVDAQYIAPSAAPCKQVVLRGAAIDLRALADTGQQSAPTPTLPKVLLATRDPVSGAVGLTLAALALRGPSVATISPQPDSAFARHQTVAPTGGGPLEVAALLGNDPVLPLLALGPVGLEEDAYLLASALRQQPLVITDCESTDLEIPARTEIVLEGVVETAKPGDSAPDAPLLRVHTMTHRRDPIVEVQPDGEGGAEATSLAAWAAAALVAAGRERVSIDEE
jgi:UbiD family decarboxylase